MTRQSWFELGPGLIVGVGILVATFIAGRTAASGWLVLAGPLLLALAVVGADLLASRLRGEFRGPSWAALILAGTSLLAAAIVADRDPSLVKTLVAINGAGAWVPLLARPARRRKRCLTS